jgi:N-acetylneuraminate synthase
MTFVIAEVGSNFYTIGDCLQAIPMAKQAGADAVKFQMASEEELYGYNAGLGIDKHFIKPDWLPKLKEKADACNIEFMCTAFSPEGYKIINPYVKRHKIASCESVHPLILDVVNEFRKIVYVSTGAIRLPEIHQIWNRLYNVEDVVFLYCEVKYPCFETNLENIALLIEQTDYPVGFSDHSKDYTTIPVEACRRYGASVLEKHFNPLAIANTPDSPHSINAEQFKIMVDRIAKVETRYNPYISKETVLKYKRRVVANEAIKKGETFTPMNMGVYRVLKEDEKGTHAFNYHALLGSIAKKDYLRGEGISTLD